MIELLLVCYITTASFTPPGAGWDIVKVDNRAFSAAITLRRSVANGEVLKAPAGCRLDEPTREDYPAISGSISITPSIRSVPVPNYDDRGFFIPR